ncbi:MAG: Spy/CpxP family protein refolding chaperone [Candidatus Omnitrophica bacterium]|nr:Spy/CpxP family protein refolding chaperone [Candidatus Omnitrophota bacterium]
MVKRSMNKMVFLALIAFLFSMTTVHSFAGGYGKGSCQCDCNGGSKCDAEPTLEDKFMCKVHMIYGNMDELALTAEQQTALKDLKIGFKKDMVRKEAEIEIMAIDIKSKLWEDKIDTKTVNELVDKKYEIKKEKTKNTVKAMADLDAILTAEQNAKIKDMCKKGNCPKK